MTDQDRLESKPAEGMVWIDEVDNLTHDDWAEISLGIERAIKGCGGRWIVVHVGGTDDKNGFIDLRD